MMIQHIEIAHGVAHTDMYLVLPTPCQSVKYVVPFQWVSNIFKHWTYAVNAETKIQVFKCQQDFFLFTSGPDGSVGLKTHKTLGVVGTDQLF